MPSSHPFQPAFPLQGTVTRKISEKEFGSIIHVKVQNGQVLVVVCDATGLTVGDKVDLFSGTRRYYEARKQWQYTCKVSVVMDHINESCAATRFIVDGMRRLIIKFVVGIGPAKANKLCTGGHLSRFAMRYMETGASKDIIADFREDLRESDLCRRVVNLVESYPDVHTFMLHAAFMAIGHVRCQIDEVEDPETFMRNILCKPYSDMTLEALGFEKCDDLATRLEIHDPEARVFGALVHCMRNAGRQDGHCYLPDGELLTKLGGINIATTDAVIALNRCAESASQKLPVICVNHDGNVIVYRRSVKDSEQAIADILARYLNGTPNLATPGEISLDMSKESLVPSQDQLDAMAIVVSSRVSVLTGPPGSGKSKTIDWITKIAMSKGLGVQLLAPTGRAAARLREVCDVGSPTTIHMWLFQHGLYNFRKFRTNYDPDVIIVDESSMVDMDLLTVLLKVCERHHSRATLIFTGDVDQLPSIGAGNVLLDMINSGRIPVARLTNVHRQGEGSGILRLALAVRSGDMKGVHACARLPECKIVLRADEEALLDMAKKMCVRPEYAQLQVITPCRRGILGTDSLNEVLQKLLNPNVSRPGKHCRVGDGSRVVYALGDKVIACKNDHTANVYNGDIGHVTELVHETFTVTYSSGSSQRFVTDEQTLIQSSGASKTDKRVIAHLPHDRLSLAYAITIHRTQGSEFPHTLIFMPEIARRMANRRLLYTAVTRSKLSCTVYGVKDIFYQAVESPGMPRYTRLAALINLCQA